MVYTHPLDDDALTRTDPPPSRRTGLIAIITLGLVTAGVIVGFALGRGEPPACAGCASAAVPPYVQQACDLNEQMRARSADGDLRGAGDTVDRIAALLAPANGDLRAEANMMRDLYVDSTTIDLTTASIRLSVACQQAGWHKARG